MTDEQRDYSEDPETPAVAIAAIRLVIGGTDNPETALKAIEAVLDYTEPVIYEDDGNRGVRLFLAVVRLINARFEVRGPDAA